MIFVKKSTLIKSENRKSIGPKVNLILSVICRFFLIIWVLMLLLWAKPYLADYYQEMANSHYDTVQERQMGPVFVIALVLAVNEFKNKRYFTGLLTAIIAGWSFYWGFLVGFSCHACTFGG